MVSVFKLKSSDYLSHVFSTWSQGFVLSQTYSDICLTHVMTWILVIGLAGHQAPMVSYIKEKSECALGTDQHS